MNNCPRNECQTISYNSRLFTHILTLSAQLAGSWTVSCHSEGAWQWRQCCERPDKASARSDRRRRHLPCTVHTVQRSVPFWHTQLPRGSGLQHRIHLLILQHGADRQEHDIDETTWEELSWRRELQDVGMDLLQLTTSARNRFREAHRNLDHQKAPTCFV